MNSDLIDNPKSERVKHVAELARSHGRRKTERFLIEGPQAVREAVRWTPSIVVDLYVESGDGPQGLLSKVVADIAEEARRAELYVHRVTAKVMHKISTDSQGVVAVGLLDAMQGLMSERFDSLGALKSEHASGTAAAFWQVRDPGNAGTVIRAADAAGCAAVIFVDECVDRFNPKVIRSTAGSLFHLPVVTMSTERFFDWTRSNGREVMAADVYGTPKVKPESLLTVMRERFADTSGGGIGAQGVEIGSASGSISGLSPRVVLFGNEARGLPQEVLDAVDRIVSIPLYGHAESLNLATSAAVMLFSLEMAGRVDE